MVMAREYEPGVYWITHTYPVTDGGGLRDEPWIEQPVLARYDGVDWFVSTGEMQLADQFEVRALSERLEPPAVKTKEEWMAELILDVVLKRGDRRAVLDLDRDELQARIVEVLKR